MIKDKLYSTYLDAICDKVAERTVELSGIPPLSFTSKGKPLTAWSITGNTVQNGTPTPDNPVEVLGCGDYDSETGLYRIPVVTRGKNLAGNYTVSNGYYYDSSGSPTPSDARFIRLTINVEPNTIYTISSNLKFYSIWEFNNNTKISRFDIGGSKKFIIETKEKCNSLRISMWNTSGEADTSAFEWIQLEEGSTATPYEPYHEPITTPIYLPTPLYSGEVMRSDGTITRSDGTTETFTAPQIPTINGTTVIDVDTAVKPESMTIKYKAV